MAMAMVIGSHHDRDIDVAATASAVVTGSATAVSRLSAVHLRLNAAPSPSLPTTYETHTI